VTQATEDKATRLAAVWESGQVVERRAPASVDAGPLLRVAPLPEDLALFYAACDGVVLADGTTLLGAASVEEATAWMKREHALTWDEDMIVLGERLDMVIVRDLDRPGKRAGGGVIEVPHDGLEHGGRVAMDLVGYLEHRAHLEELEPPPEVLARRAFEREDRAALEEALTRGFYRGAAKELARGYRRLGALHAELGHRDLALAAFERVVAIEVEGASPRARERHAASAYRACAQAAADVGALALAADLAKRAG
jgi:tetratricopeptide (TPR) repeat protein